MSVDLVFPFHCTQVRVGTPGERRPRTTEAAFIASSADGSAGAIWAPDIPAQGNSDRFTHLGQIHEILRFYPGDEPAEVVPHHRATAEIPTTRASLILPVDVTARTPHLVHVVWIDDDGEILGAWCPNTMVTPTPRPESG